MFAGIDIGTGSLKAVAGFRNSLYSITERYDPEMFSGGCHRIHFFHESVMALFRKLSSFASANDEIIEGMSLSGHGPSFLIVDNTGNPLTEIITWQDNSAWREAAELGAILEGFFKDGTSFESKLYKMYREKGPAFLDSSKVLYPKDYVIYLLTGRMIMDASTASTLHFFNREERIFCTGLTGIPEDIFPDIVEPWEEAGRTGTWFSRESGLNDGIPVMAGGIDAWCEALGAGAVGDGMVVDGSGTSTCITCCKGAGKSELLHVIPDKSIVIETMSSTGASLLWLERLFRTGIDDLKKAAGGAPVPVIYLPYLNGERSPVWDEKASGSFTGLVSSTTRDDLVKSVFQGIAFGTKQCLDRVSAGMSADISRVRAVGGGAGNRVLLQYKADISGIIYLSMKETDAAPLGAMMIAAFGCGEAGLDELVERWVEVDYEVIPDKGYSEIWDRLFTVYADQYKKLKTTMHELFELRDEMKMYL